MGKPHSLPVDINNTDTWTKYKKGLCDRCVANCCTMPVEAKLSDLIRMELVTPFEAEHEELRLIARQLKKEGLIDNYNPSAEIFTLARMANRDCLYLDTHTRRCTIYAKRPDVCRKHPQISPRPNFCPYEKK